MGAVGKYIDVPNSAKFTQEKTKRKSLFVTRHYSKRNTKHCAYLEYCKLNTSGSRQ
jgi:hypothetical protein